MILYVVKVVSCSNFCRPCCGSTMVMVTGVPKLFSFFEPGLVNFGWQAQILGGLDISW